VDRAARQEPLRIPAVRRRGLLAAFLLLASASAFGAGASGAPLVRGSGSVLRPGDVRELEIAVPPAGADEWEAFLSVDGGRSFPFRITPHLPIAERSFSWTVPLLPTASARIRLRFGVGGIEQERVAPDRFAIDVSAGGSPLSGPGTALRSSPAPGEEDTLVWVERSGSRTALAFADPLHGIAPESRWSEGTRDRHGVPRRRPTLGRPAHARRSEPSISAFIPPGSAPRRRSLASVSRLNL
jgi:hypothetical protein